MKETSNVPALKKRSSFLQALHYTLLALLLFFVYTGIHIFVYHWSRVVKLSAKDFKRADFKVISEIPTSYYESGNLGGVLREVNQI